MPHKLFNVNPPVDVEIQNNGGIGDVLIRADIGADGTYDSFFDFFGGQGSWEDHLVMLLQAAGRTDVTTRQQAAALLLAKSKEDMDVTVKEAWNAMLKALADILNLKWKPASTGAGTGTNYTSAEEFFTALLSKTQAVEEGGKLVLRIP